MRYLLLLLLALLPCCHRCSPLEVSSSCPTQDRAVVLHQSKDTLVVSGEGMGGSSGLRERGREREREREREHYIPRFTVG